jgi:DNA repair protein RadD
VNLRDYQQECVTAVWNEIMHNQTALVVMSTGSGKSVCIYELIRKSLAAADHVKCLVLFDTVLLLSQQAEALKKAIGTEQVSIYCGSHGEYDLSGRVVVGTIQSLKPDALNFNLILVDEAHVLDEKSGRYIEFLKNQMDQNPKTKIVGFTATPYRADGYIYGKNKFFSHPTFERGLKFFINKGILVPPVAKQPDHQMDLSKMRVVRGEYKQEDIDAQAMNKGMAKDQVIDALNRAQDRKKILWFCSSINHAELINDILDELGEYSVTLHSKLETDERSDATNSFMNGEARHLTFITVVSKGWDYPPVDCIVMMRPTRSPSLMVQVAGRGLRRYESKSDCLILDYANVISTMGPLEDPAIEKKGKGTGEAPRQKTCPECRAYIAPRATECPHCGFTWPKAEATKLMLVADENAPLLEKEFKTLEISKVQMKLHVSKAGNKCIRIDYLPKNFFQDPVAEYFTVDSDFGMKKFILRSIDLGIDLKSSAEEQVVQPITKIPTLINYVVENRYPKIKGLKFI